MGQDHANRLLEDLRRGRKKRGPTNVENVLLALATLAIAFVGWGLVVPWYIRLVVGS